MKGEIVRKRSHLELNARVSVINELFPFLVESDTEQRQCCTSFCAALERLNCQFAIYIRVERNYMIDSSLQLCITPVIYNIKLTFLTAYYTCVSDERYTYVVFTFNILCLILY